MRVKKPDINEVSVDFARAIMKVCRFYSLSLPTVLAMKCPHFMAHYLSIIPLAAAEKLELVRISTNPFLLENQQDYLDELRDAKKWGESKEFDQTKELYDGVAKIEAARKKGGIING